jgi:hypothetical protein
MLQGKVASGGSINDAAPLDGSLSEEQAKGVLEHVFTSLRSSFVACSQPQLSREQALAVVRCVGVWAWAWAFVRAWVW